MKDQPQWEEIGEFGKIASRLIEKYPERFAGIDLSRIIAYKCTNKDRPEKNRKNYEITGEVEPESFTNSRSYFVKVYRDIWERDLAHQTALVFSVLDRIDPEKPGKIKPLDYVDQEVMVNSFGPSWYEREDLPNVLENGIDNYRSTNN